MKSYNGVAILSKVPFTATTIHHRCGKEDCRMSRPRSISAATRSCSTISTIPAGGDIPDPEQNVKFAHKHDFYREMAKWYAGHKPRPRAARACAGSPSAISTWRP